MQRSSRVDYDAIAELYDSTPHREKSADPELTAFLAGCGTAASLTLLDIACGTGNQQIANRGLAPDARFAGLDGSLAAPIRARQFGRRCAVPKAKFKGVELVRSPDEGRRLLRALHIYIFENE